MPRLLKDLRNPPSHFSLVMRGRAGGREMMNWYFSVEGGYGRSRRRLLKQHQADRQKAILALRLQQLAGRYTAPRRAWLGLKI